MNSSFCISDEQYKTGRKPECTTTMQNQRPDSHPQNLSTQIIARAFKVSALAPFSARPEDHTGNNENYTCLY
jgi:hypothetical protein